MTSDEPDPADTQTEIIEALKADAEKAEQRNEDLQKQIENLKTLNVKDLYKERTGIKKHNRSSGHDL